MNPHRQIKDLKENDYFCERAGNHGLQMILMQ
jgi:hypothetical protein